MSDFVSSGWSIWITTIALLGIVFCLYMLISQRKSVTQDEASKEEFEKKVWDGDIREQDNSAARWFNVMYVGLCIIAFVYLLLYPGLGSFPGLLHWTAATQRQDGQVEGNQRHEREHGRVAGKENE